VIDGIVVAIRQCAGATTGPLHLLRRGDRRRPLALPHLCSRRPGRARHAALASTVAAGIAAPLEQRERELAPLEGAPQGSASTTRNAMKITAMILMAIAAAVVIG